jgi:hypothetical protein
MPARVTRCLRQCQEGLPKMNSKPASSNGRTPFGQSPASVPMLLTPGETAEVLKLSLSWLAKRRLEGNGPAYIKVGRSVRYQEPALLQ